MRFVLVIAAIVLLLAAALASWKPGVGWNYGALLALGLAAWAAAGAPDPPKRT